MRSKLVSVFYMGITLSLNPTISSTDAFHPLATTPLRGIGLELRSAATASILEVSTVPIQGMRPGTSGLRKKVEVWQGIDDKNKYYLHNFIQSLIETAAASNHGKMLDT